jgi:hypothetical protein
MARINQGGGAMRSTIAGCMLTVIKHFMVLFI